MTITVPLTKLRPKLPQIINRVTQYFDRCVITRRGEPEAVILADEDYESLIETLEILSDTRLLKEIKVAEKELRKGKGMTWPRVKKKLGYV